MTPHDLLAAFETIADAPGGVKRLRELVLQLAVRGKLVPHDPNDQPFIATATPLRQGRRLGSWEETKALPFEIPDAWIWCRIGELGHTQTGATPPTGLKAGPSDPLIPFVRPNDIHWWGVDTRRETVLRSAAESTGRIASAGSIYMVCIGSIGKSARCELEATFNQQINTLTPALADSTFIAWAMRAPFFQESCFASSSMTTIPILNKGKWESLLLPIPPLSEQLRIVARVNELMNLLDRLEVACINQEEVRHAARDATLAVLRDAEDSSEEEIAWNRISIQFNQLFVTPDDIASLRNTVLEAAMNGLLVPQIASENLADELLSRCNQARTELTQQTRTYKGQTFLQHPKTSKLPQGWVQCTLRDCAAVFDPNPSHRYPDYIAGGIPLLSTREFSGENGWDIRSAPGVTNEFWEYEKNVCHFAENGIVFARKGRLGLARKMPTLPAFAFSHTVFAISPLADFESDFLLWMLRRPSVVSWLEDQMSNNTGVPTLGKAVLERLPIKVPPVAEQRRIVAKINELMALCDSLGNHLTAARELQAQFAAAAVHHLDA
jgi:type I restriction enzyme S subunit